MMRRLLSELQAYQQRNLWILPAWATKQTNNQTRWECKHVGKQTSHGNLKYRSHAFVAVRNRNAWDSVPVNDSNKFEKSIWRTYILGTTGFTSTPLVESGEMHKSAIRRITALDWRKLNTASLCQFNLGLHTGPERVMQTRCLLAYISRLYFACKPLWAFSTLSPKSQAASSAE